MRSGKLDKQIKLQRFTAIPDGHGGYDEVWADFATLRAQMVQATTEEFIRAYGASDETVAVFRTRYLAGVKTADRVVFRDLHYDIKEIKEIDRQKGLEIRAVARRPGQ